MQVITVCNVGKEIREMDKKHDVWDCLVLKRKTIEDFEQVKVVSKVACRIYHSCWVLQIFSISHYVLRFISCVDERIQKVKIDFDQEFYFHAREGRKFDKKV